MKKEEIKKIYQNYRLYIFPAVVAFSSLILIVFIIYPQIISLIENSAIQKNTLNKSKLLEVKAETLESLDLGELNVKVSSALNSYPTDKDSVYALSIIQRVVNQLGFKVISLSLGSIGIKNTSTQSYSFKLEISGPISLLPSLLTGIENSPRLMRISGVEVGSTNASSVVNVSLALDMLYAAAPTGFGSIDSPLPDLSEKDNEVIDRLARISLPSVQTPFFGLRGKANPFE